MSVALPSKRPAVKISSDGVEPVPVVNGCDFQAHVRDFTASREQDQVSLKITNHVIAGRDQNAENQIDAAFIVARADFVNVHVIFCGMLPQAS